MRPHHDRQESPVNVPRRAAIYTRVSTDEQAREGLSLGLQADRCAAHARAQGWDVVEVYTDAGVSGAKGSRPALDRLLADVNRGAVDVIVIAKLDRLGRATRYLAPLLADLDDRGVGVVSLEDGIDSSTTSGRFLRGMLGVVAEMERDMIRERTRGGQHERVRQGGWGGGDNAPWGYRIEGSGPTAHLVVDEDEARAVRTAVDLLIGGLNVNQVAARLNALGLTPRTVPYWTGSNLRGRLVTGQFDGTWTFGKTAAKGTPERIATSIPAVLDPTRAAALQAHLGASAQRRTANGVHPLSGRLRCLCGQPMTGMNRSDRNARRYRCSHYVARPDRPGCANPTVLAQEVDDAVWTQVLDLLTDPALLMDLARERVGMLQGASAVEADALAAADAAEKRAGEALGRGAAQCIALGLDTATTATTLGLLRETHRAAAEHRSMVATLAQETDQARRRMVTAQELAAVAADRLRDADPSLRARVLALLDVRVDVVAYGERASIRPVGGVRRRQGHPVTVQVSGSVAHDLLLTSMNADLAPVELAPGGA